MTPLPNNGLSVPKHWGLVLPVAISALILAHYMALIYRIEPTVSLWFPPAGVAVALTLWFGPLAALLTALTSVLMAPLWGSEGWFRLLGLADGIEPLIAWLLYRHVCQGSLTLTRLREATALILSGPVSAAAISASLGSFALALTGKIPIASVATLIPHWWLGNALGIMAITPTALLVLTPYLQKWGWLSENSSNEPSVLAQAPHCSAAEVTALLTFCLSANLFAVSNTSQANLAFQQLSFLSFIPIIWAATRFGVIGGMLTSTFSVLVTLLAYIVTYPNALTSPSFPVQAEILHVHQLSLLLQCAVSLLVGCITTQKAGVQVALAVERVRATEYRARAELSDRLALLNTSLEESNREKDEWLKREQAARQQVSKILESITDAFFALDGQGRFTYVNQQAAQFFQKQPSQLLDQNIWQVFPEAVDTIFYREYRLVCTDQVTATFEGFYAPFDTWVEVHAYPNSDGLSVFFRDIGERKRMQEELHRQQQELKALAENSPDVISRVDRQLRYLYVNPAIERATGLSPSAFIGKTDAELGVPPQHYQPRQANLREIFATGQERITEFDFATADGTVRSYQARMVPEFALDGTVETVLGVVREITDLKRTEAALRASEARLRRLVDSNIIGIFFGELGGQVTDANEAFLQMMGYGPQDLSAGQLRWDEMTPPEYRDRTQQALEELRTQGMFSPFEKELIRSDGSRIAVMIGGAVLEGSPEEGVCYVLDISDRKQAEEALRYLAQTSIVLSASLDYEATLSQVVQIAVPKLADWCVVDLWTEDGSLRRLPIAHADSSKRGWASGFQQYAPDPKGLHPIAQVLRSGRSELIAEVPDTLLEANVRDQEHLRLARDLGVKSLVIVPLAARGRILGALTFVRTESSRRYGPRDLALAEDLAGRAALAIDNAKAHREAQEANRIKDEFLAVLSHELRSPLNPILGWVQLLRSRKLDEERTKTALEAIERNARLQVQLIEDLLDISRILQGKISLTMAPVELAAVVEAASDTVRLAAEAKSIEIVCGFEPGVGAVAGDGGRLQQVVWNLLSNAIKFTPTGGRIEVGLWMEGEGGRGGVPMVACLRVSDTGVGISPEFLPYVFEHFRQADASITRNHGGLGLGLAIARYLVELHGGTIQVQSEGVGKGAAFTVRLPLMKVQPERWQVGERLLGAPSLEGVRVLLVDDEPDARDFASFLLEEYGAQVQAVSSAREAIAVLAEFKPDVLVSDMGMPQADGYALIAEVRSLATERGGGIPAVALTAYAREEDSRQAVEAGFQLHLSKPVEPVDLVRVIASLVKS